MSRRGPLAKRGPAPKISLTLLGGFEVRIGAGPPLRLSTKKATALLAYLALPPGRAQLRDKIAALLWGESADAAARGSLRYTLARLRRDLPPAVRALLVADASTVALDAGLIEVDAVEFERAVAAGTTAALEHAAGLYRGDLLAGTGVDESSFEEWLVPERERLRELAMEALAKLLAGQARAGETERALQTALRLLGLDPLQEVVHRALMRLYARQGRRGAALRQYQACVRVLQRELGVEPEPETQQLYQEILRRPAAMPANGERSGPATLERLTVMSRAPQPPTAKAAVIGRESELTRLREALDETRRGSGRVVIVTGEAGIGKTRLLREVATEAIRCGARVFAGRAHESAQIVAFGPWAEALRSGDVPGDGEAVAALAVDGRTELSRLLPELGEPPAPATGIAEDSARLFEAVAQLLERLAARAPLVMLLDDLHWSDEESLRLLSFLSHRVGAWPVLIAAAARHDAGAPELRRVRDELRLEPRTLNLTLLPLSRSGTASLVQSLIRPGLAGSSVERLDEQVWRASEGNPLVAMETLRVLVEGTETHESPAPTPPRRAGDAIASRLDRPGERAGARASRSWCGDRCFWVGRVRSVTGDPAPGVPSVEPALAEAGRAGHDATAGRAHLELARDCFWSGQPRRGLAHGLRAVALLEPGGDAWWIGRAYWVVGINHEHLGELAAALAAQDRAGAIGASHGDRTLQTYAAFTAGRVEALRGESTAAVEACRRALELAPAPNCTVHVQGFLGCAYLEAGEGDQAVRLLEQAVRQVTGMRFRASLGWFTICLGQAYRLCGDLGRAEAALREGLEVVEEVRYAYGVGTARRALGRIAQARGAPGEAGARLGEALRVFEASDARFEVARTHLDLADVARLRDDGQSATMHCAEAERLFAALDVPRYVKRARRVARAFDA